MIYNMVLHILFGWSYEISEPSTGVYPHEFLTEFYTHRQESANC